MDTIPIAPTTYMVIAEGVGNTPADGAPYPLRKKREPQPSACMRSEGYGSRSVCVCVCVCYWGKKEER